jgi:acyl carrier protein
MQIERDIVNVIAETLNIKPEEVKIEGKLDDSLGVDSTEMVDLSLALEKKFGVKIAANEITKSSSPRDISEIINKKKGNA